MNLPSSPVQEDLFDTSGLIGTTSKNLATTTSISNCSSGTFYVPSGTVPNSSTTTAGGYVGGTSISYPSITPTITTTTVAGTGNVSFPNNMTWHPVQPPGKITAGGFELSTKIDDDGKDTLILSVGDRKKCAYKCQLLPGIFLYTDHGKPGFFQRLVLRVLFGMKWENTLAERFIEAL